MASVLLRGKRITTDRENTNMVEALVRGTAISPGEPRLPAPSPDRNKQERTLLRVSEKSWPC